MSRPFDESPQVDLGRIFVGGGEMGRLCRSLDWAKTPLGAVESWPQSLRTAAGMVLEQGIAQSLCWGPDLVQVYNDGYRIIMGDKHPNGLGRSVLLNWSEIADDIRPLFDRVLKGETVYFEDLRFSVKRGGATEDAYFTFSYSPVRLEDGEVGGALINCFETTRQVHARAVQAERDRLFDSLAFERSRLRYIFEHAPAFVAVVRGADHTFDLANPAYLRLVGHRDLLGRPVREALPEVLGQGFIDLLDDVLNTGKPVLGDAAPVRLARSPGAAEEERFVDFAYLPLIEADGTPSGVIAHGYDVTEQVRARREVERLLRESEHARFALEELNEKLLAQQTELETANLQLQETTIELEMQAEELQVTAAELEVRTSEAEGARAEAERAREHLTRMIEQAPVAMYIATGREHVFEVVNESYYAMVGKRPEDMIGRPGREVFPELMPQGVFDIIDTAFETGEAYRASAIPAEFDTDGDGIPETHFFNLVYQPLLDSRDEVYAIALVATEVTELVQAREVAEASQRAAEAANQAKSEFLAAMSHELRTPLNAIGGYIELLEMGIHGPVNSPQLQALYRVKASQRHLLTLINDILSHARIQAGRTEFQIEPLSAAALIASAEALVMPQALARDIEYQAEACDPGLRLLADEERVRQILLNLVGNAIKFTEPGGWVRLSCDTDDEWAHLRVRDNGRGIPPEKLESIFDPFTQVGRSLNRPEEGVGLGLAISRELARGMDGDIFVESEIGTGSVFTLRLRIADDPR